ncbi:hypothetical protein [Xylanimonas sp. McL0601]|uniref:hypothetical protein n=1 Tax=Xylanimonas sp. McL0601 TaxID=3414739 RepID=UPI003CECAF33
MLYQIRVRGQLTGARLHDFADVVVTEDGRDTVLTCRVRDAAALTGVVALLNDLGLTVKEMHSVPDVENF